MDAGSQEFRILSPGEVIWPGDDMTARGEGWCPVGRLEVGRQVDEAEVITIRRRTHPAEGVALRLLGETSRDHDALHPWFRDRFEDTLAACRAQGVELTTTCTYRPPDVQAKLWRQSRLRSEIDATVARLKDAGRPIAAWILESVGLQDGKVGAHVTHALPGESFHHYGLAADVAWVRDGAIDWSTAAGGERNGYRVFRAEASARGLYRGPSWDWAHIQAHPGGLSSHGYSKLELALQNLFKPANERPPLPWGFIR